MRILFFLFFNAVIHCQENFKTVDNFLYDIDSKLFKIISNDIIYSFCVKVKVSVKKGMHKYFKFTLFIYDAFMLDPMGSINIFSIR